MKNFATSPWRFILLLFVSCASPQKNDNNLGELTFDISASKEAKPLFLRGHLLMHSFEFTDAAEAFREAQKTDPSCVMAYWGEAMTNSRENATQLDIDQLHVMEMELEGLKAWKQNDLLTAEKWFKEEATALEERISYFYGPPSIVKPSHELYGEFLLSINRPDDGRKAFNAALQRAPKRVLSLKGKMQAAKALNDNVEALEIEKQLQEI
jgi:tetratricopeptide (TPR) repeat protein